MTNIDPDGGLVEYWVIFELSALKRCATEVLHVTPQRPKLFKRNSKTEVKSFRESLQDCDTPAIIICAFDARYSSLLRSNLLGEFRLA
jgi:hypothetical protein